MPRSLTYLLLVFLSLIGHIRCAENDTDSNAEVLRTTGRDEWLARDIKITEPHSVLLWKGSSPHRRFFYLTWDGKKKYCEVTQVLTGSANGASKKCRYQFNRNERMPQLRELVLDDEESVIGISYSTSETRRTNSFNIHDVDFKTCQSQRAPEANQTDSSLPSEEVDAKKVRLVQESDKPLSSRKFDIYSNANGRHSYCNVNDERTQIACTQYDPNDKVAIDNVKYDLPSHWKADWFAVHNTKSGGLILFFSDCPDGACKDYSRVRFTAKGWDGKRYVGNGMDLRCSDKTKVTVDVTDQDDEWVCIHAMCSDVKTDETLLRYRRTCMKGDHVA